MSSFTTLPVSSSGRGDRAALVVYDAARMRVIELPRDGRITIGRSPDCTVVLEDTGASRMHAEITLGRDGATLVDSGSQNGTLLNGIRIDAPRPLTNGDAIDIGGASLILHLTQHLRGPRQSLGLDAFLREVDQEVSRSHTTHRRFALFSIRSANARLTHATLAARLRPFDVSAVISDDELLLLWPELDADPQAVVTELRQAAGDSTVGYALYPQDAVEASTLASIARGMRARSDTADAPSAKRVRAGEHEIVIAEPATEKLFALVGRLAQSDLPILVRGETGVGKELVARAVHAWSARARGPFVGINCAALPEQLAESELFGHERGAFSGAVSAKPGLLETASGGTVFLDEIGDLAIGTQAKLLRVLETRQVARLGAVQERAIDVRLVAATHRNLELDAAEGRFRLDLYYRIAGGIVLLPPLRERPQELVVLARAFMDAACKARGRAPMQFSDAALVVLTDHGWPGNIRELKMVIEYLATAHEEPTVTAEHVTERLASSVVAMPGSTVAVSPPAARATPIPLRDEIEELEKRRIGDALKAHGGHQANAATSLGMPLRTFVDKMRRYGFRK